MEKNLQKITSHQFEEILLTVKSQENFIDINICDYEIEWSVRIKSDKKILISNCKFNNPLFFDDNLDIYLSNVDCWSLCLDGRIKSMSISNSEISLMIASSYSEIGYLHVGWMHANECSYINNFVFWGAKIKWWLFYNTVIRNLEINSGQVDEIFFDKNNYAEKYILRWNHSTNSICHNWLVFSSLELDRFVWWMGISFINCVNNNEPDFEMWREKLNSKKQQEYIDNNPIINRNENWERIKVKVTTHVLIEHKIRIKNSNLDKTQFHNCNFKNSNISIENSNLTEIITTNFELPENINSDQLEWKRENYRQLKFNFSKQWDSFNALKYHNKEMETLSEFPLNRIGFWNYVILMLSSFISNNGTNWLLVLYWIICFNFISFIVFLHLSSFPCASVTISEFLLANLKYAFFLSDMDTLRNWFFPLTFSIPSQFIFYATKIFNAILFYHLIISFRKFNKEF